MALGGPDGGRIPGAALAHGGRPSRILRKSRRSPRTKASVSLVLLNPNLPINAGTELENSKEVAKDKIPPAASPTPLIRPGPRPATETAFHDGPRRTDTPASLPKNSPSVAWVVMQVVTTSKQRSRHSHRKDTKAI
ncbi:hypothetical protein MCOR31_008952 [Pyricularia oryzae]|nr:hypothetical protein MCOR01_006584 [Pyricularia oryzae]KAI6311978.1 hypothetical protein MCOR34_005789 [Pyricularia oryzae]KAI6360807.1 hypothetical protein MCOR31_008952 [Pyricularia oryzae]KAI6432153.1 hypothetical protein MCOR21_003506 [Pyricularia oryzae]KAI6572514.1 hypothetical protein MCOR04_007619 [Pyricularia oryzae]